jgi:hypothetical protein
MAVRKQKETPFPPILLPTLLHPRSYTPSQKQVKHQLSHLVDELAHVLLSVSGVTTLDVADELPRPPAAGGVGELEGPERRGDLLEVRSASGDLVDEVLDTWPLGTGRHVKDSALTDDAELAELLLDDGVVGDGDSLTVNLGVTSLVDELSDSLEVDLSVGDVRLNELEHLLGGLGDSDEDTVVDLEESEELQDLLGLGGDLGDTGGLGKPPPYSRQNQKLTPSVEQRSRPWAGRRRRSHRSFGPLVGVGSAPSPGRRTP